MQPTDPNPIVIKKSRAGLVLIYAVGFVAVILLGAAGAYLYRSDTFVSGLLGLVMVLTLLLTLFRALVYSESEIILMKDRLIVDSWMNGQTDSSTVTLWNRVTDINVLERGILALTLGFGTLKIQVASGDYELVLPYVGDPEKWRDQMIARVEAAPELVHEA